MKSFKEFNDIVTEETRPLEERLKFDYGFSINKEYHVQFNKNGTKRSGMLLIPSRGFPILTLKESNGILETYKVVKDNMRSAGSISKPYAIEQFDFLMKQKPTEIKM